MSCSMERCSLKHEFLTNSFGWRGEAICLDGCNLETFEDLKNRHFQMKYRSFLKNFFTNTLPIFCSVARPLGLFFDLQFNLLFLSSILIIFPYHVFDLIENTQGCASPRLLWFLSLVLSENILMSWTLIKSDVLILWYWRYTNNSFLCENKSTCRNFSKQVFRKK